MSLFQSSQVNSTFPFIVGGRGIVLDNETIAQDALRTAALQEYTVMAQIVTGVNAGKWVPWTNLTASDGSAFPMGILMVDGGVSAAMLAAGDVSGVYVLAGGARAKLDGSQLIFDTGVGGGNVALSLSSALSSNAAGSDSATPYLTTTGAAWLRRFGIYVQTTVLEDLAEN